MTLQHSPRHRAAGPAGFGRSPWPSQPIAVVPSPRPPSERPGWFRATSTATTGETATAGASSRGIPAPRVSTEGVRASRRPLVRLRPRAATGEQGAAASAPVGPVAPVGPLAPVGPAPRHAAPEGLAEVADLETVLSTPVPLAGTGPVPTARRRTGGAIVPLVVVRPRGATAPAAPAPAAVDPWSRGRAIVVGALAVVVVLTGAAATTLLLTGAVASRATPPTSPWAQAASALTSAEPPAPTVASPIATLSGDGRLVVGADIAAGVYRSAGPISPDHDCSWSRRGRTATGETVLASGVPTGPATVTVRAGDAVFVTRGCAPWTRLPG